MADEFYGGKTNNRKAFLQLLVHRPEPNTDPDIPEEFVEENATEIHVLKAKPHGIARSKGNLPFKLLHNWKTRRYYEYRDGGVKFAKGTRIENDVILEDEKNIVPALEKVAVFNTPTQSDFEEMPF